jgi:arabinofuranosyltransferase
MMDKADRADHGGMQRGTRLIPAVAVAAAFAVILAVIAYHAWVYYFLCDDAYISFRYARNLVDGYGLVYNRGERVEGYTNFLWVLELATLWKLFGLTPPITATVLSVLCTVGSLSCVAWLAVSTPFRDRRAAAVWLAFLLLAANRSWAVWTTSGLETRQFTFLILLAVCLLRHVPRGARMLAGVSLCMAAAEYTRPEGLLLWGCGLAWLGGDMLLRRELRPARLAWYALPFAVLVGAHYAFRLAYYGEVFPNTYYAKLVRPWPEAGMRYILAALIEHGAVVVVPLALAGTVVRIRLRRDFTHVLAWTLIVPHSVYLVRIGGDHFEFRPLDFYWPLLAVAAADGALWIASGVARLFGAERRAGGRIAEWAAYGLIGAIAAIYTGVFGVGKYLATRDRTTRSESFTMFVPLTRANLAAGHALPLVPRLASAYNAAMDYCISHFIATSHQEHKVFWQMREREWSPYREVTGRRMVPDGCVMVDGLAGVMPYYLPDVTVIDFFGLTDRHVARIPVTKPNSERHLAHDRMADMPYLLKRGVNINIHPACASLRESLPAAEFAMRVRDGLFMPFDAFDAQWVAGAFRGRELYQTRVLRVLGGFEGGLGDGWEFSGTAFGDAPSSAPRAGQEPVYGMAGAGYLNSWQPAGGADTTGTAVSPEFGAEPGQALRFRFTGGLSSDVGVALLRDGVEVRRWTGRGGSILRQATHEFGPEATGARFRIRVFDESCEPGASVMADDFIIFEIPDKPGLHLRSAGGSGVSDDAD